MKTNKNPEPAFPYLYETQGDGQGGGTHFAHVGMSLRAYLACRMEKIDDDVSANHMAKLAGILPPDPNATTAVWAAFWLRANARWRVRQADALIEALDEVQP